MKQAILIFTFAAILLILPVFSINAFDFSKIENNVVEHTLDNGLTFVIFPRHDAPVVSINTIVNTGCADDPKGYMGLAHMFEHMAFKGTEDIGTKNIKKEKKWIELEDEIFRKILAERAKGDLADSMKLTQLEAELTSAADSARQYVETNEFSQIIGMHGGVGLNAGTSFDNTSYYISLPSNKLELWMAMESDRFANPILRELYKEKDVVAEERRFRVESSPTGKIFFSEYPGIAYNAHPYGRCMIGEMSEIENYNRDVMREYFETRYIPRNMTIGIVGDVDPDEAIRLAEKYFDKLEDKPEPMPVDIDEPETFGIRKTVVYEEAQPIFIMGFHIPSMNHPDWPVLEALASYFGQGRTSVLYKKLVKEEKTAVEASSFVGYPGSKYPSLFSIICVPSNESTNEENENIILEEIYTLRNSYIPTDELEKIKARARAQFINGLKSNMGLASQLAYYELMQGDWRKMFRYLDRIEKITQEDLVRVAMKYLDPEKRVVAYLERPEEEETEKDKAS